MSVVTLGIEYFADPTKGRPVANGFVYVGEPDTDPTVVINQKAISLLQENGTLVATAQPVGLGAGGVPMYQGSPVKIITEDVYSILVQDSGGAQVYYAANNASATEVGAGVYGDLRATTGAVDGNTVMVAGKTTIGDGFGGQFYWDSGDFSAEVTNDPTEAKYVPPTVDLTGASGCWIRADGLSYATYDDLRLQVGIFDGQNITIGSRATIGDGGGGIFYWNGADLSTAVAADSVSGIYVAPTDDLTGASGAWVRQYNGAILAEWFGTDNAALVAAFAAMTNSSEIKVSTAYAVSGSSVVVDGLSNITISLTDSILTQQTDFSKTLSVTNCTNVVIKNGVFVGRGGAAGEFDGVSTSYNGVAGIFFDDCTGVEIYGNKLTEHAGGSIVWRDSDVVDIHNNEVIGIGAAFINPLDNGQDFAIGGFANDLLPKEDFTFSICENKVSETAFGIFNNSCDSIVINDNNIKNIRGQHGVYLIECSGVVFSGNSVKNCGQQGFKNQLEGYQTIGQSTSLNKKGMSITGNTFSGCQDAIGVPSTVASQASDQLFIGVTITGNTINDMSQDGINLNRCIDINVSNNVIKTVGRSPLRLFCMSGKISDNMIDGVGDHGMFLTMYDDTEITNNTIADPPTLADDYPIYNAAVTSPPTTINAAPKVTLDGNSILYPTGSDADAYIIFLSDAASQNYIRNTVTESAKVCRLTGPLVECHHNQFVGFNSGANNSPTAFLKGSGRRDYHGQQDPATASSTLAFTRGDRVWNTAANAAGKMGWVCTVSGSPGTWKTFGDITA